MTVRRGGKERVVHDWVVGQWRTIGYVAVSALLIYVSTVIALRFGERRTLAEMTIYDFAMAVALGAIIGRTATTREPTYAQGVAAVVSLLLAHHALSWLRLRVPRVRRLTDRSPIVLVRDGVVDGTALRRAHLTDDDLRMALRQHGVARPADVRLAVLESRGAFSVIARGGAAADRPVEMSGTPSRSAG